MRRDRVVVVAALVLVIVLSWVWVVIGAGLGMSAIEMTRMPRDMMMMTPAIRTPAYAALMYPHAVGDDAGNDAAECGARAAHLHLRLDREGVSNKPLAQLRRRHWIDRMGRIPAHVRSMVANSVMPASGDSL